ncbi:MAG: hypothetical protein AAF629_20200, partial [Chloroflexota bacterium]
MPRINLTNKEKKQDLSWQQTIIDRVKRGKVVPLVSNQVALDLSLGGPQIVAKAYQTYIDYPSPDPASIAQMVQYRNITEEALKDKFPLSEDYISFIKSMLFERAEKDGVSPEQLAEVDDQFDDITFTDFCQRLGYPQFEEQTLDPFQILASCPLDVYLTTSHHSLLEIALEAAGKSPKSDFCHWHQSLDQKSSVFGRRSWNRRDDELVLLVVPRGGDGWW